jgi:hypothetical protein
LIHQIVGAASIKQAVTVGDNVLLTFGKETESISAIWNVSEVKKERKKEIYQSESYCQPESFSIHMLASVLAVP